MKFEGFVEIEPIGKPRPRFANGRAYFNAKGKANASNINAQLWEMDPPFITDAVEIHLEFYMPRGKTVSRLEHTVKPDLDNLVKQFLDSLNGIVADDKQVTSLYAAKYYADGEPGIKFKMVWD